ncbi:hypothetical protein F0562_009377 [Nyssa sinensis]|uniref:NB-ARC domain-containing protein n=1 Tax=Nyssa sinensis TaxID=561372 RepID=A0A5J4ZYH2_9ASTE|nr:hypothetical protein F0562_009377 [Nyssa sinensis]
MAEIVLSAVIQKAADIAANLISEEFTRLYWLQKDISWIETEMRRIRAFLKDADAKQDESESEGLANFVNDMRDLAYDVGDIMDTYFPKVVSQRRRKGFLGWLKLAACIFSDWYVAHNFSVEIEQIRERVKDINEARTTYGITENGGNTGSDTWNARRRYPHVEQPNVVGFEEHIDKLKAKLLGRDSHVQQNVISIVGMPGLELLQDIAGQVGLEKEKREEQLEVNLFDFLMQKRYVIVIDDIWDTPTWDALSNGIPKNSEKPSRIIITSRNTDVGIHIGGQSSLHTLQPMDWENSKKLFFKLVMVPQENTNETIDPFQLEELGEKMLHKCGGVPLAIVLTAGLLLLKKKTKQAWEGVLASMGKGQDECSKILALSYKDLPIDLKPCFLYFGVFPEDYEISAVELINLWAAEGFIQGGGEQEVEEVGEDYLNNLITRNLIQVARKKFDGRIKSCRIHDLLHELCITVAEKSNFFNTLQNVTSNPLRRVTVDRSEIREHIASRYHTPKLRALLCFNNDGSICRKDLKSIIGVRFLRVLRIEVRLFPSSFLSEIGNLSLLSYLRLCGDGLEKLPRTISKLKYLLTLDFPVCPGLKFLPDVIWKMKQLRQIYLRAYCSRSEQKMDRWYPIEISLPNLQTLIVRSCDLNPIWLHKFTSLRKLHIWDPTEGIMKELSGPMPVSEKLEKLRLMWLSLGDVHQALNLFGYRNLSKLSLRGRMNKLPSPDKLPPNLTKLTLEWNYLEDDPMETLKKLPKLKILILGVDSYKGRRMVCSGGLADHNFIQLEELEIVGLVSLEELIVEEGGMPRLNKIRIIYVSPSPKMVPERFRSITTWEADPGRPEISWDDHDRIALSVVAAIATVHYCCRRSLLQPLSNHIGLLHRDINEDIDSSGNNRRRASNFIYNWRAYNRRRSLPSSPHIITSTKGSCIVGGGYGAVVVTPLMVAVGREVEGEISEIEEGLR